MLIESLTSSFDLFQIIENFISHEKDSQLDILVLDVYSLSLSYSFSRENSSSLEMNARWLMFFLFRFFFLFRSPLLLLLLFCMFIVECMYSTHSSCIVSLPFTDVRYIELARRTECSRVKVHELSKGFIILDRFD